MRTKQQQNEYAKDYSRTLSGRLNFIYRKQIARSKERGYPPPAYTFNELKERYINDPLYIKIFNAWVDSGYNKQLVPSLDRPDSTKPYTFKNIEMMTWAENRMKQAKVDIHNSHDTPVAALIAGKVVEIFSSQAEAISKTGAINIVRCLTYIPTYKKEITSGGYVWKSLRGITKDQFKELKGKLPILFTDIKFTPKPHKKRGIYNGVKKR